MLPARCRLRSRHGAPRTHRIWLPSARMPSRKGVAEVAPPDGYPAASFRSLAELLVWRAALPTFGRIAVRPTAYRPRDPSRVTGPRLLVCDDTLVVDSIDACRSEAGCLLQALDDEQWKRVRQIADLLPGLEMDEAEWMQALARGVQMSGVSMFKSVGVATQDAEITRLVIATAESNQIPF